MGMEMATGSTNPYATQCNLGWIEGLLNGLGFLGRDRGLGFLTDHDHHPLAVNLHIGSGRVFLVPGSLFFLGDLLLQGTQLRSTALMMFYSHEVYVFGHGPETAIKLQGSSPHDQLLIKTSDSFSGLLLFTVGFLLFMVAFVKDREFQSFFAKGCVLLHLAMAIWRVYFERKLEDLARDWPRQVVGDVTLALSWVFFLVYSWREKYD
ncbi:uncharacterized protein E5676_scaffold227G00850 [Cucumis melo var. makuwa]|uniref:DUF7865 domain-containing protein n=1 Tax=Cucumis melo var. makuwa TaxID=1194695 RepID=A0A5D3CJC4_CUCMM|nr:uncharacterized protein E6C27_scaffold803G00060 [Cucumis melo var. makuwa]TYK11234.1 uncharacterized protein E5676_scaffold227G00850 [Cucumis melo var. makuwa]